MSRRILAIQSSHDLWTTQAAGYRTRSLLSELRGHGREVELLEDHSAVYHRVAVAARAPDVGLVTGVGHGLSDRYRGWHDGDLLRVGSYDPATVRGKIVHLLACDTAVELGPDLVRNGCQAFFGYRSSFAYSHEARGQAEIDLVFDCDAEIDRLIAAGLAAGEVHDRTREKFTREVERLRRAGRTYAAGVLEQNRDALCGPSRADARFGDPAARLV